MPTRPDRPALRGAENQKRASHQALRARMLHGQWADDLERALERHITRDRRAAWGVGEISRNPFRSLSTQVGGALYRQPPHTAGGSPELREVVDRSGYWQLMQRVSVDLVGMREQLVRVDWTERGGLLHRPVPLDLVEIEAVPEAPDRPARLVEAQVRLDKTSGRDVWVHEEIDCRDMANPVHRVWSADHEVDRTAEFLGEDVAAGRYQFIDASGDPYVPAVLYHAERTGSIWDPWYGLEAVLGSLTVGVLLTFWIHGVKDGSFATVLLSGGRVVGARIENPDGSTRTEVISVEPGSIVEVAPVADGITPSVVQLRPGFDPEALMRAISQFEQGLAEYAGISSSDLVRTGADPRSGASLAISREGLRSAQARMAPNLRQGDLELLAMSARVLNGATGSSHAVDGYSISYPALPLSTAEIRAQTDDIAKKIDLGLMSPVDAYMLLHPGISRDLAVEQLRRIRREREIFGAGLGSPLI